MDRMVATGRPVVAASKRAKTWSEAKHTNLETIEGFYLVGILWGQVRRVCCDRHRSEGKSKGWMYGWRKVHACMDCSMGVAKLGAQHA